MAIKFLVPVRENQDMVWIVPSRVSFNEAFKLRGHKETI